jgi:hypothetical protein
MLSESSKQSPIFILGISQRSGTNYLSQLIRQHPSCSAPETIWEDFLVCHSDLLLSYANAVSKHWNWKSGTPGKKFEEEMFSSMGDGLVKFLSSDAPSGRLVAKTPDVSNIDKFFKLFPQAYLIILVRDGRAVAESRVKTFRESYDVAIRKWLLGAKTIVSFQRQMRHSEARYLLVRYEDVWNDVETELRRIFHFCHLDAELYDYTAAQEQPVKGSSEYRGEEHREVHWVPMTKPADFNPTDRWKYWKRSRHELFNHVAGDYLEGFGYQLQAFDTRRALWYPLVRLLGFKSKVNYVIQLAVQGAKRMLAGLLSDERTMQIR